jgi:hypothetical protein
LIGAVGIVFADMDRSYGLVCIFSLPPSPLIKELRIKEDGKMITNSENQQNQNRSASQLCQHVLQQRIYTPKQCILSYECYHCAYDHWLFEIECDVAQKIIGTETCKASLAVAA